MITETQIKKWNESFKALSKPEKRVAIAKDVIAQIKAKKYIPTTGDYVEFLTEKQEGSIQKNFDKVQCNVCAIGSLFMSKIKFTNKCNFDDVPNGDTQAKQLEKYFSKKDIALMEYVFEDWCLEKEKYKNQYMRGVYYAKSISNSEIERIEKAQKLFEADDPEEKLIKMMRHLIKNNGSFVI